MSNLIDGQLADHDQLFHGRIVATVAEAGLVLDTVKLQRGFNRVRSVQASDQRLEFFHAFGEVAPPRLRSAKGDDGGMGFTVHADAGVVTLLHIYARARGMTRQEAFRWSLSVFAKMFPISFGRCRLVGCILVRDGEPRS